MNQILPNVFLYDGLINKAVNMSPNYYAGNAIWTSLYTINKLGENETDPLLLEQSYGPPGNRGQFPMNDAAAANLFCLPFNNYKTFGLWPKY